MPAWAQLEAPEIEISVFAQSVAVEERLPPEQIVDWYARGGRCKKYL
jgi:hypothetical protein